MVGFTLLSRSYYYLRRRSPGPPFPPDHRQAGERGAINNIILSVCLSPVRRGIEPTTCFSLHHAYTPRNWCPHSHCVSYSSTLQSTSEQCRALPINYNREPLRHRLCRERHVSVRRNDWVTLDDRAAHFGTRAWVPGKGAAPTPTACNYNDDGGGNDQCNACTRRHQQHGLQALVAGVQRTLGWWWW